MVLRVLARDPGCPRVWFLKSPPVNNVIGHTSDNLRCEIKSFPVLYVKKAHAVEREDQENTCVKCPAEYKNLKRICFRLR